MKTTEIVEQICIFLKDGSKQYKRIKTFVDSNKAELLWGNTDPVTFESRELLVKHLQEDTNIHSIKSISIMKQEYDLFDKQKNFI